MNQNRYNVPMRSTPNEEHTMARRVSVIRYEIEDVEMDIEAGDTEMTDAELRELLRVLKAELRRAEDDAVVRASNA